ncbi:MAG TPA: hypothetical protein VIM48_11240 [Chthoniobacterales bacterium]
MTLIELSNLVCLKVHRNDDASIAEAKAYLRARYEMIWNSYLWRDTLCEVLIPANDVDQVMILPGIVDRVVNVLWDARPLAVESLQIVYRAEPMRINAPGDPGKFAILAPSGVSVSPDDSQLRFTADSENAFGKVSVRGLRGTEELSETVALNGMGYVFTANSYTDVLSLSKDSTDYALHVTDVAENPLLDLDAAETSRAFQRISLISQPVSTDKTVSVLAKRRVRPLINDSDATELSGIDNALLALGIADMLEGQRQYAKAQAKMQEASSLVDQMTCLEREQSASVLRIVPSVECYDWK